MLPVIAVLHPLHRSFRSSATILGTIAGTAAVAVGLLGAVNVDVRPAALFVLGIWWWTIGKVWFETGALPRAMGLPTAALGALALAGGIFESFDTGLAAVRPGVLDLPVWAAGQLALGAWLVALAAAMGRSRR